MWRKAGEPQFGPEDEEIVQSYLAWAAVALQHTAHSDTAIAQQTILNESLLSLARYVLTDSPPFSIGHVHGFMRLHACNLYASLAIARPPTGDTLYWKQYM